ncbi:hypothetical protein CAPN010_04720 [Capnocytophaga cynodegmi]|uniref:hypothetical protein n=1 Tax=Capnocytophaga cynodegmi TaxID=28189 RepID=UPI001EE32F1E|nr:hypothetical protein [Capnocytophaga cynodegmi]GJQ06314.1 hypothetical protein CAPN010_04720 [Capnocytophaga cynodegmi]
MKVNKKVLWELVFNFILIVSCLIFIYILSFYTENELIEIFQKTTSNRTKRSREIDITILNLFGKKGYYIAIIIGFILVFKYRFLPSLRKFLGKEVDKKEENEE